MTRKELETLGLEKEVIDKIIKINGDDIENAKNRMQVQIDEANNTITALNNKIKENGDAETTIADLQNQIKDFQDKETARLEAEKKAKTDAEFNQKIKPIFEELGIKDNAYIRNGLTADVKKRLEADNTLGIKDILTELTKDNDDFKVNPQNSGVTIPPAKGAKSGKYSKEQIANMSVEEINENWNDIKESI